MTPDLYWLLMVAVGLGVRHIALRLPISPDVLRRYREQEEARHQRTYAADKGDDGCVDDDPWDRRPDQDDDSGLWIEPLANVDGTPMLGDLDANGNPFGVTNDW